MSALEYLYAQAEQRRIEDQLPYAGALTPTESCQLLQLDSHARLIDVRTRAELDWIGRPVAGDGQYAHIEWIYYPGSAPNVDFIEQLRDVAHPDTPVLLLCRSAQRSKRAAMAAARAGFTRAFDLLEGFEGERGAPHGHRKTVNGWCFHGLPWSGV